VTSIELMREAIAVAQASLASNDVPVGALIVDPSGKVIATGPTAALQAAADAGVDFTPTDQQTAESGEDVGGDGTGAFINDVRDAEAETAMGYGPEEGEEPLDEFLGLGNKTAEEWAKTSSQMAKLLQFRAKAVGTPYADQVEKRIQLLKDRLDMDAGEVAGPGGMPKDPVPPEKFDMKQLREADDDLLNKMRAIAGLR
jgi:hypothetical protein